MNNPRLILGDAAEVLGSIPDVSIDLTLTSPPYDGMFGLGVFDFGTIAAHLFRVTKPGGIVCWNVQDQVIDGSESLTSAHQKIKFGWAGFRIHETIIKVSRSVRLPFAEWRYPRMFEYVFVLSKGKPKTWHPIKDRANVHAGKQVRWSVRNQITGEPHRAMKPMVQDEFGSRSNVWIYSTGGTHTTRDKYAYEHPALMSEECAADLISSYSNPGDLVLDPFAGAGTTPKMAILSDRDWLGIEISLKFFRLAQRRVAEAERTLAAQLDAWLAG